MLRTLQFVLVISLVNCTTVQWKRKKPAYWEFPETTTSEKPDFSAEYCKTTNMDELGANLTEILAKPIRGHSDTLLKSVVTYVLTLHRFIRKSNSTDDIAIKMARDLIQNKRPKFLDMELDMPTIHRRVGFDKFEFQHFQWVMEDIKNSWEKLRGILFDKKPEPVIVVEKEKIENSSEKSSEKSSEVTEKTTFKPKKKKSTKNKKKIK